MQSVWLVVSLTGLAAGTAFAERGATAIPRAAEAEAHGRYNLPMPGVSLKPQPNRAVLKGYEGLSGRPGTDVPELIYSNILPPFFTLGPPPGGSPPPRANLADDVFTRPGPAAGGPVLITGIKPNIAVALESPTPQDYDVLITFWDSVDETVPVPGMVLRDRINAEPLRVGFVNPTAPGFFSIPMDFLDLTVLPGGGIRTADDEFWIQYQFVEAGTTTKAAFGTVAFAGGGVTPVGTSDDLCLLDYRPEDGNFASDEAIFFGGPPNLTNFWLELQGERGGTPPPPPPPPPPACAANCNRDTTPAGRPFLDIQDFTCFQNAFATGDRARADVGGSAACLPDGNLDIFDFTCFQNLFAIGCP